MNTPGSLLPWLSQSQNANPWATHLVGKIHLNMLMGSTRKIQNFNQLFQTAQAFYPTLPDALSLSLQQLFSLLYPPTFPLQQMTTLNTLPLLVSSPKKGYPKCLSSELVCKSQSCWYGISYRCSSVFSWQGNSGISVSMKVDLSHLLECRLQGPTS